MIKKVLFVQSQESWVEKFKKNFNGNYPDTQFDFRRTPASRVGRFIWGLRYDVIMIDYGWSINGLRKQISQISPQSKMYTYSQLDCSEVSPCNGDRLIKKDVNVISRVLESKGIVSLK